MWKGRSGIGNKAQCPQLCRFIDRIRTVLQVVRRACRNHTRAGGGPGDANGNSVTSPSRRVKKKQWLARPHSKCGKRKARLVMHHTCQGELRPHDQEHAEDYGAFAEMGWICVSGPTRVWHYIEHRRKDRDITAGTFRSGSGVSSVSVNVSEIGPETIDALPVSGPGAEINQGSS